MTPNIKLSKAAKIHLEELLKEHNEKFGKIPLIHNFEQYDIYIDEIEESIRLNKPFQSHDKDTIQGINNGEILL